MKIYASRRPPMIEKIIGFMRKKARMARAARMAVPAIFLMSFSLSAMSG